MTCEQPLVRPRQHTMALDENVAEQKGEETGSDAEPSGVAIDNSDDEWQQVVEVAHQSDDEKEVPPPPVPDESLGTDAVRKARFMRRPGQPSKADKAAHDALHINFRSWCRYCVMGKGQHRHHPFGKKKKRGNKKKPADSGKDTVDDAVKGQEGTASQDEVESEDEEAHFPLISLDYCFMGTRKKAANRVPILVVREVHTKWLMAYYADKKGPVPWIVDAVIEDIKMLGYGNVKVVVKTDGEEAIIALRNAIIDKRSAPTVPKLASKKDPQSHGDIEVGVKMWAGQFRTLKFHTEGETGKFLPISCPAVTWLVQWAANSMNLFKIQDHGVTAHEAIGGRVCKTPLCPFGEHIQWKRAIDGVNPTKAESEWFDGIFLGVRPVSGESIVGSADGIVYCRTVRRVIDEDMWSMEGITRVAQTVRDVTTDRFGGAHPHRKSVPQMSDWSNRPQDDSKQADAEQSAPAAPVNLEASPDVGDSGSPARFDIGSHGDGEVGIDLDDEDAAFDLFGPDDLVDAPIPDPSNSRSRTSDGVRVMWTEQGIRVSDADAMAEDEVPTGPSSSRRRRIDSDDDAMIETEHGGPSKRGRAQRDSASEGMSPSAGDSASSQQVMNEIQENRQILAALLRGADITEVYSPERVVKACRGQNLVPGTSMDLTNGWDFTKKEDRDRAVVRVNQEKPNLLIGSPPCTLFSIIQNLNLEIRDDAWRQRFYEAREDAIKHINFCVKLYRLQASQGRYWLHEHPKTATSWQLDIMKQLVGEDGVLKVDSDLCRFGMVTKIKGVEFPAKKPTSFATNSWAVARELERKCKGDHIHGHLMEGRAKAAAVYPPALCKAICRGLRKQLEHDRSGLVNSQTFSANELASIVENGGYPQHWVDGFHEVDGKGKDVDDVHGNKILREQLHQLGCRNGVLWARGDGTGVELDAK